MHAKTQSNTRTLLATLATLSVQHMLRLAQQFTQEHPMPP